MRPDMMLVLARVFISGAGLSYSCVYMMLGRYKTFISEWHENLMSPFHAGMKSHAGMETSFRHNFLISGQHESKIDMMIY